MKWKLAFYGAFKHKRRMILILFSITLSIALMEILTSMGEGLREHFYKDLLKESGHVQITNSNWDKRISDTSLKYLLSGSSSIVQKIRLDKNVKAVEGLLYFDVILHKGKKDLFMQGIALQNDDLKSSFYPGLAEKLKSGHLPVSVSEVLLSARTAAQLGLSVGDEFQILSSVSGKSVFASKKLAGTYETVSSHNDDSRFFVSYKTASGFLGIKDSVSSVRVMLDNRNAAGGKTAAWQATFGGAEVKSWNTIFADLVVFIKLFDVFMGGLNLIFSIVAATIILNAVMMNVLERSGEYGTMRAIGVRRSVLRGLILREGLVLGLLGTIAGILVAYPVDLYFQRKGIVLGAVTESLLNVTVYHFQIVPLKSLFNGIFGLLIAVLAYLYSSRLVIKMPITSALHKNSV